MIHPGNAPRRADVASDSKMPMRGNVHVCRYWNDLRLVGVLVLALCCELPQLEAKGQSLFNGRNLEGWAGDENIWSVQDGQIIGATVGNRIEANTFLVWQGGDVSDFRLTFRARMEGENNSGVQYRGTLTDSETWRVAGYQADIHPKPEYTAMLYSEGTGRGIIAERGQKVIVDANSGKTEVVGRTGVSTPVDLSEWHEYAIIARGNHLVHQIDGTVAVDVTDNHKKKLDSGIIALQVHAGPPMTVFFKDIVLETFQGENSDEAKDIDSPDAKKKIGSVPREIAALAAGFRVEKVFEVPESMGSWVSITADERGRLIASDQGDKGLFLITPGPLGSPQLTEAKKLPVNLSGAQGLVWGKEALYAMVSNESAPGLHRLIDTDDDGLVDSDEHLVSVPGRGEHGPHAVVVAPDGRSLYVAAGNHTDLPQGIASSRIPQNWGEDLLLPRLWDARGHAKGRLAPGGWVCKVDPTGKEWEVISVGYRNLYDIAFNADGELFAYDADMEWDMGLPWYRPTRLVHVSSGSEFGWRSGTGKWPTYYEDSLPPVLELGPGSPTGVVFGYGAKFPAKYQKALFLLDWTFGTIYAVHLTPDGASYRGKNEEFITGKPLPVTDAVVGADGALYFTVGGREMQSALYRVIYSGDESTIPVPCHESVGAELRMLRHELETMHGTSGADFSLIFANLGHEDRFIRYTARIALESQPVNDWRQRALSEPSQCASITAILALARQGNPTDRELALQALDRIDLSTLDEAEQLALFRAYGLVFIRLGEPIEETRQRLVAKFDRLYPSDAASDHINMELVQLLVHLRAPSVIEKTLALMDRLGPEPVHDWKELTNRSDQYGGTIQSMIRNMPPLRAIHFAFVLRNVKSGWSIDQRRKYFTFFLKAAKRSGGMSYTGFLTKIREDALAACSPSERVLLEPIVNESLAAEPFQTTPVTGPGRHWTKTEALQVLRDNLSDRDLDEGRNLFHVVSCAKCHRLYGEGGAIGPDLSTAARKFSLADLLDSILEPSKVISDQFESHLVQTIDGLEISGRAIEMGDEIHIFTDDPEAAPKVIQRSDIVVMRVSKVSQMPRGLIDMLNQEELKDLVAYIMSSGE